MAIKKIDLCWVVTSDLAKSKQFFTDTLGLKLTEIDEKFGWLELQGKDGGMLLGVGKATPESGYSAGKNAVVTFTVDNFDQTVQELGKKGISFFGEINVPGVPRMINFKDHDGNLYQLVSESGH